MAAITTRQTAGTGATVNPGPLNNAQLDANFINLNTDKLEIGGTASAGTANCLLYLNGSKAVTSDSNLVFTSTGLGIGTSSPSAKLSVVGQAGNQPAVSGTIQAGNYARLQNTGSNLTLDIGGWGGNGNWLQSTHIADLSLTYPLLLNPNGGNIGIGTLAPSAKLDVSAGTNSVVQQWQGAGTNFTLRLRSGNGATQSTSVYRLYMDYLNGTNTNGYIDFYRGTDGASGSLILGTAGQDRIAIIASGNVGIGTTNPGYKLEVSGSFAATTKSFVIPHPTVPGKKLRYGSLEGPENGVYVRGKLIGNNKIELPEYWTKLVDPDSITVNLTPIGRHQDLYVEEVVNNTIIVKNSNLINKEINCYYIVFAERVDVDKLEVEIG